jgi:hypothetical protein
VSRSELLAERVRAAVDLAEERWRNHERAHEALASALSDYKLAANEWQLKHRYAMTLHTDSGHPHVHVVLMARDFDGNRSQGIC